MITFKQFLKESEKDIEDVNAVEKNVIGVYAKRTKHSMKLILVLIDENGKTTPVSIADYFKADVPDRMNDIHQNYIIRELLSTIDFDARRTYNKTLLTKQLTFQEKVELIESLGGKKIKKAGITVNK